MKYIDFAQMTILERLAFNREGKVDDKYVLTEEQFQDKLDVALGKYGAISLMDDVCESECPVDRIDVLV